MSTLKALNVVILRVEETLPDGTKRLFKQLINLDDWADCTDQEYLENMHRQLGHTNFVLIGIYR